MNKIKFLNDKMNGKKPFNDVSTVGDGFTERLA